MLAKTLTISPVRPPARMTGGDETHGRKRLPRHEREKLIVEEAIRFFAEVGFEGQTRALAERLGVTQPLLYRYFPDKSSLIDRVYHEVYLNRWNPAWGSLLTDRTRSLRERMTIFYHQFYSTYYTYEGVRIFLFAGLKGLDLNTRGMNEFLHRAVMPICAEIRHQAGLPSPAETPLLPAEIESFWTMHSRFFYRSVRQYVYGLPMMDDLDQVIESQVGDFADQAPEACRRLFQKN
ncbi:MAG: TetR/AcrR family transcriptional regulator [Alphaproteobacteria bacterium]|nr:TetR/AcrR family transcriptional regulator [Alphaproteobacteria bacterium]